MASPAVDVGTGTTAVFGTSSFSGEITSIQPYSMSRESVETTHMGTATAKTFTPADLYDGGELTLEMHFNPDTSPPISGAAETCTITFPSTATAAFSCFMTEVTPAVPLEDKMTLSASFKITGAVTITAAA